MKISATPMSQKWINHPRSWVGKKALLVGSVASGTSFMCPIWTNPVKNMIVSGVP